MHGSLGFVRFFKFKYTGKTSTESIGIHRINSEYECCLPGYTRLIRCRSKNTFTVQKLEESDFFTPFEGVFRVCLVKV